MPNPDLTEFEGLSELEALRKSNRELQRQLRKAKARTEDLVDATFEGAKSAFLTLGALPPIPAPKLRTGNKHKTEIALWHLTDWQGGKLSTSYNSDVMQERVLNYCDKAEGITAIQRADHPVNACVMLLGGDFIEGLFNFPSQPFEVDSSIFDQYGTVALLLANVIRRALTIYKSVHVVGEWGNHGRIGSKRAAVPRHDNFDRMILWTAQQLLVNEKRLSWTVSAEDTQPVEIGKYRAVLMHGDEVGRNGYAAPTTIVQHVTKWKSGSYRINGKHWPFRDAYLGHYHQHAEWPLPDGEGAVYQSGSPESDNRYAGTSMAASAFPSQRLHFVDPEKGHVTAQYKIWLRDK